MLIKVDDVPVENFIKLLGFLNDDICCFVNPLCAGDNPKTIGVTLRDIKQNMPKNGRPTVVEFGFTIVIVGCDGSSHGCFPRAVVDRIHDILGISE